MLNAQYTILQSTSKFTQPWGPHTIGFRRTVFLKSDLGLVTDLSFPSQKGSRQVVYVSVIYWDAFCHVFCMRIYKGRVQSRFTAKLREMATIWVAPNFIVCKHNKGLLGFFVVNHMLHAKKYHKYITALRFMRIILYVVNLKCDRYVELFMYLSERPL